MHTKEEITKKKSMSFPEQLDLVETISGDDKIRKKRFILYLTIFLTVGLSFSFYLYRLLQGISFRLPELPQISFSKSVSTSLESQITDVLGKQRSLWTYSVLVNPEDLVDDKKLTKALISLIKDYLPEGLEIVENYQNLPGSQTFSALISLPEKNIYFTLNYAGSDNGIFKSNLSKIVPLIYWDTVRLGSN